ncbi:phage minor structural protein [Ralstonia phage RSP15]|uniref:tail fiber protein n=1 Tax=Ralstonia phage RSP15 TaxID=1785960 RepID=UPI00074D3A5A|nr:tail fiber protein [Ralstonia phage RSP15]BAU40036.1 phage minor structural protein [Ralstonia phage RSP15]
MTTQINGGALVDGSITDSKFAPNGKVDLAFTRANDAITQAAAAGTKADGALAKANAVEGTANNALSVANAAQSQVTGAVNAATAAQNAANAASTKADNAQTTANSASTKADNAQTTANSAVSAAATADSKATSALKKSADGAYMTYQNGVYAGYGFSEGTQASPGNLAWLFFNPPGTNGGLLNLAHYAPGGGAPDWVPLAFDPSAQTISQGKTTLSRVTVSSSTDPYSSQIGMTNTNGTGSFNQYWRLNKTNSVSEWINTDYSSVIASLSNAGLFKAYSGFDANGQRIQNVSYASVATDAIPMGQADIRYPRLGANSGQSSIQWDDNGWTGGYAIGSIYNNNGTIKAGYGAYGAGGTGWGSGLYFAFGSVAPWDVTNSGNKGLFVQSTGNTLKGDTTIQGTLTTTVAVNTNGMSIGSTSATNSGIEFGNSNGTVTTPFLDFHSSGNNIDYDARIVASGGNTSVGQGTLNLNAKWIGINGQLTMDKAVVASGGGDAMIHTTPDGGAFVDWASRRTTLNIDCPDPASAYGAIKWTQWGSRHLASIEGYAGGTTSSTPMIVFNVGGTSNHQWSGNNYTASGTITAQSDERYKKDWQPMPEDFIELLAEVLSGSYSRTDIDARQDGVGAQSLQKVLPNSVLTDKDGRLSVAYGNAALVAAIELAKQVVDLKKRVAQLEGK